MVQIIGVTMTENACLRSAAIPSHAKMARRASLVNVKPSPLRSAAIPSHAKMGRCANLVNVKPSPQKNAQTILSVPLERRVKEVSVRLKQMCLPFCSADSNLPNGNLKRMKGIAKRVNIGQPSALVRTKTKASRSNVMLGLTNHLKGAKTIQERDDSAPKTKRCAHHYTVVTFDASRLVL